MSDHPFSLRENPFAAGDVRRFVHPSPERESIQARLLRGLRDGEPFVLLTGESGTGKTSIVRETFGNRKDQGSVAIITNPALTRTELLEEICIRFDIVLPETPSKPQLIALLEQHLTKVRGQSHGLPAVLVVDEAHLLDPDLLEELRLLANMQAKGRKLLQVVLVGLPALEETLAQHRLEPLRQRISVHARLDRLSAEQTLSYLHHRLVTADAAPDLLPEDACLEIHQISQGIVREINTLASEALVWAHSEGATAVSAEHVRAVVAARPGLPSPIAAEADRPPEPARARAAARRRRAEVEAPAIEASESPKVETVTPPNGEPAEPGAAEDPVANPPAAQAATPEPGAETGSPTGPPAREASFDPATQVTPRRRKGEAEVYDWVSRFKGEGPIQIGSRVSMPALSLEESLRLDSDGEGRPTPGEGQPPDPHPRARPASRFRAGRRRRGSGWWNRPSRLALAAVTLLAATAMAILISRGREPRRAKARAVHAAAASAAPGSPRSPERKTERVHTPAHAMAGAAPPPVAESARSTTRAAATDSAAALAQRYALVVATYLDEDRAREEIDRLTTLTALPARSRVVTDATGTTYRILVGRFESRSDAEQTAEDLLGRGIVGEARITRLGPRRNRR